MLLLQLQIISTPNLICYVVINLLSSKISSLQVSLNGYTCLASVFHSCLESLDLLCSTLNHVFTHLCLSVSASIFPIHLLQLQSFHCTGIQGVKGDNIAHCLALSLANILTFNTVLVFDDQCFILTMKQNYFYIGYVIELLMTLTFLCNIIINLVILYSIICNII